MWKRGGPLPKAASAPALPVLPTPAMQAAALGDFARAGTLAAPHFSDFPLLRKGELLGPGAVLSRARSCAAALDVLSSLWLRGEAPHQSYYTLAMRACEHGREQDKARGLLSLMTEVDGLPLHPRVLAALADVHAAAHDCRGVAECMGLAAEQLPPTPQLIWLMSRPLHTAVRAQGALPLRDPAQREAADEAAGHLLRRRLSCRGGFCGS
eukprot:TRINITY_DN42538_c0_g1_i2.p2 TRINITY_DN42538_c0_g1~~TRINITY_DN42538_c0_g1_i2.p2  ORF type:complete len:237 (+),score=93.58 TRINITY_DN42538_c0_g1_i2:82-711(+)